MKQLDLFGGRKWSSLVFSLSNSSEPRSDDSERCTKVEQSRNHSTTAIEPVSGYRLMMYHAGNLDILNSIAEDINILSCISHTKIVRDDWL
jgi:hypothetical protein